MKMAPSTKERRARVHLFDTAARLFLLRMQLHKQKNTALTSFILHSSPICLFNQSCIILSCLYGKTSYPRNGNFITVPGVFLQKWKKSYHFWLLRTICTRNFKEFPQTEIKLPFPGYEVLPYKHDKMIHDSLHVSL